MVSDWFNKWDEAYKQASFFRSDKNSKEYWDTVADSGSSGLDGLGHIEILEEYLIRNNYIDENTTLLDAGCGLGDYTLRFAKICKSVTAMDYSANMLNQCEDRCLKEGLNNVFYLQEDIRNSSPDKSYDGVLACLNPSTYSPLVFDRLLKTARKFVVYFSMDNSIGDDAEPVYKGSNSVKYPSYYLEELGMNYKKISYTYFIRKDDGSKVSIPFAYLIVDI